LVFWAAVCSQRGLDGGVGVLVRFVLSGSKERVEELRRDRIGLTAVGIVVFQLSCLLYCCTMLTKRFIVGRRASTLKDVPAAQKISTRNHAFGSLMHQLVRLESVVVIFVDDASGASEFDVARSAILLILASVVAVPDLIEKLVWPGLYTMTVVLRTIATVDMQSFEAWLVRVCEALNLQLPQWILAAAKTAHEQCIDHGTSSNRY